MSRIYILHVSDLHYSKVLKKDYDQGIVLQALFQSIKEYREREKVNFDLVIFTGDLVQAGDHVEDFNSALQDFVTPLTIAAKIPLEKFFIVPGNHDISRKAVATPAWVEGGLLNELKSSEMLNKFLDEHWHRSSDSTDALKRVENYESFVKSLNTSSKLDTTFVKTYLVASGDKKIGIACFNSAWRATGAGGSSEKGNLLIGERSVDRAIESLHEADIKLAAFHHPLGWLSDFDGEVIKRRLEAEFVGILCGHTHTSDPVVNISASGTSFISQCGSLYNRRDYFNGYQIVSLETSLTHVEFLIQEYDDRDRKFYAARSGDNGRISFELKKHSAIKPCPESLDFVNEARKIVKRNALNHIVLIDDPAQSSFDDTFVCPPISNSSEKDTYARSGRNSGSEFFELDQLLSSSKSTLLFGKRECGKTSLAFAMALRCLEGINDGQHVVPIIVDFRKLTKVKYKFDQNARAFYEQHPSGDEILKYLSNGKALVIMDNFQFEISGDRDVFKQVLKHYPGNKWVLLTDEELPTQQQVDVSDLLPEHEKFYIHTLQRKQIRKFTDQWSERFNLVPNDTFDSVMAYMRNGDLPRTGYILSLLLWAISKKREAERVNEATLLENIVEMLLEKSNYQLAKREEFDYPSRVFILRKIGCVLKESGSYLKSNDITQIILGALKERALDFDAVEIFNLFVNSGILTKDSQNTVSFKYISFQEYFVAQELDNDRALYQQILERKQYLSYDRELELLTGIRRENPELLNLLKAELEASIPEVIRQQDISVFSKIALDEGETQAAFDELDKLNDRKVSSQEIDDAVEMAERRFAKNNGGTAGSGKIGSFIGLLSLYGRVIRNLEWNKQADKLEHISFYFECWIKFTLAMTQSLKEILAEWGKEKGLTDKQVSQWLNYVCNIFFPIVISFLASENVGTRKLDAILKNIAINENSHVGLTVFSLFTLLDQKGKDWHVAWKDFLKDKKSHGHAVRLCIEKLTAHLCVFPQSTEERKKFTDLIANTSLSLSGKSRRSKGAVLAKLDEMAKDAEEARE